MALTTKQEAFCVAYVSSRDAKQSALEAGYSESYAQKKAYALLGNEEIAQRIEELERGFFSERFTKLAMRSMVVLDELLDGYDDRTRLATVKEVFRFYGLEKKLGIDKESEDGANYNNVNIIFNEVPSRKVSDGDE